MIGYRPVQWIKQSTKATPPMVGKTDSEIGIRPSGTPRWADRYDCSAHFSRNSPIPDHFYQILAADSVRQISEYAPLNGRVVLDVGGGPGYFADAFRAAGAHYLGIDPDVGELSARGAPADGMVRASGTELPVRTGSVDICYSSNVLEHVADPVAMLDEMVRVTKPGGTVFVSFTPWFSPWGGHETAPWHFLGGHYARRRYVRQKRPRTQEQVRREPVRAHRRKSTPVGPAHRPSRHSIWSAPSRDITRGGPCGLCEYPFCGSSPPGTWCSCCASANARAARSGVVAAAGRPRVLPPRRAATGHQQHHGHDDQHAADDPHDDRPRGQQAELGLVVLGLVDVVVDRLVVEPQRAVEDDRALAGLLARRDQLLLALLLADDDDARSPARPTPSA